MPICSNGSAKEARFMFKWKSSVLLCLVFQLLLCVPYVLATYTYVHNTKIPNCNLALEN